MRSVLVMLFFVILSGSVLAQEKKVKTAARPNIPGSFIVDLGINQAIGKDSLWDQGIWGSRTVNLYYQYPIRFGRSRFSFNPGVGLSLERWKFKNGLMLINPVETGTNGQPSATQIERWDLLSPLRLYPAAADKSMFITNYLEVPLEIRFDTKPEDIARSFNVALGARFGYLIDAFTKVRYRYDGEKVKVKDKYDHGLTPFRYGVYTRIGIGGFNVFGFYNLTTMFQEGKGPHGHDINTLTVGLSINGF